VIDRGGPVASCWEWHGNGTAGENDVGSRLQWRHQLGQSVRPSKATRASSASREGGAAPGARMSRLPWKFGGGLGG
jgi:hypothetical protein